MENSDVADFKVYLKDLANSLDGAERIGAAKDVPEGVRYVQFSDTLARIISSKLRDIADMDEVKLMRDVLFLSESPDLED